MRDSRRIYLEKLAGSICIAKGCTQKGEHKVHPDYDRLSKRLQNIIDPRELYCTDHKLEQEKSESKAALYALGIIVISMFCVYGGVKKCEKENAVAEKAAKLATLKERRALMNGEPEAFSKFLTNIKRRIKSVDIDVNRYAEEVADFLWEVQMGKLSPTDQQSEISYMYYRERLMRQDMESIKNDVQKVCASLAKKKATTDNGWCNYYLKKYDWSIKSKLPQ